MKKITLLFAVLLIAASMQAQTMTWSTNGITWGSDVERNVKFTFDVTYDITGLNFAGNGLRIEIKKVPDVDKHWDGREDVVEFTLANTGDPLSGTISGNITIPESVALSADLMSPEGYIIIGYVQTNSGFTDVSPDAVSPSNGFNVTLVASSLGTNDYDLDSNVNVYPSPATGIVTVNTEVSNIEVLNVNGQKVLEISKNWFDVSKLNSGLYFAKILTTENKIGIRKVIVK